MIRILLLAVSLVLTSTPESGNVMLVVGEGLREPFGVDLDAAGRVYIVEMGGNRISVLDPTGPLRVLAGTGEKGSSGDEGPAARAQFNGPHHLLLGPDGQLYIADTGNNCVRRINLKSGRITRVAGTGAKGFGGDGGPAQKALFGGIYAIAFRGRVLYICDLDNRRVRTVSLDSGVVSTVAGNGETGVPRDGEDARTQPLVDPRAIAVDETGNLYICERGGHALRVVDPSGRIRTVAGDGQAGSSGDGGPARAARLNGPKHISVDPRGDVLIADTENHVVRRYSPRDGTIQRVAGTGVMGAGGVGGPALSCALNRPHGATTDPRTGMLYISDSENHRVLRVDVLTAQDSRIARTATASCAALAALQLPDARITDASAVAAARRGITVPYCKVSGVIGREIRFEVLLPDDWNRRFVMGGGGGFVGRIDNQAAGSVNVGYASAATDTGHQATSFQAHWALGEPERQINFGHLAVHRTTTVAKAIVRAYYEAAPRYAYFFGCSNGGRQGLMEAQRYPEDFDGIVAGAPAFNLTRIAASFVRNAQATYPNPASLGAATISRDNLALVASKVSREPGACSPQPGVWSLEPEAWSRPMKGRE